MSSNPTIAAANVKFREVMRQYELLQPRDRMILNGLAIFLLVLIVFFVLVKPATDSVVDAEAKLENSQAVLQWMINNKHLIQKESPSKGGQKGRRPKNKTMLSLVNSTSSRYGVTLKRYKPEGDDKLHVWLDNVEFNSAVKWLNKLQSDYSVGVVNISIDSGKKSGFIKAKIILRG